MPELSDFFESLYAQFVLRDILAKVVPGFLALYSILLAFSPEPMCLIGPLRDLPEIALLVLAYAVSFMVGMFIQHFFSRIGLTEIHVWPGIGGITRAEMSLHIAHSFSKRTQSSSNSHVARIRERLAILKEMSANYAGAVILIDISLLARCTIARQPYPSAVLAVTPILAALAIFLVWQNRFHAREQRTWETSELIDP